MDEKIEEGDPRKSVVNARAVAAASKILGLDKPGSSSAEVLGEGPPGEGDEQSAPVLLQPPAEDAEMKPEDDAKMEPEDAEMKHEDEDMDMKPPEGADAVPRLLWQPPPPPQQSDSEAEVAGQESARTLPESPPIAAPVITYSKLFHPSTPPPSGTRPVG